MTGQGPTELKHLTYDGNFDLECKATVLAYELLESGDNGNPEEQKVSLELDMTCMHPQGGGQPSDMGTIQLGDSVISIEKVLIDRTRGNAVTHVGQILNSGDSVSVGSKVEVSVDADRRLLLSECHTAGHVIDAAMARCGKTMPPTKGFHYLDGPYVEYKGSIPPNERDAFLKDLKEAFQDIVNEDIPTKIETLSIEEAEGLCNRLQKNFDFSIYDDKEVRIVTVANWPCPCGGTHVKSTGALNERGWSPIGIKSKKGVVRIRYGPSKKQ